MYRTILQRRLIIPMIRISSINERFAFTANLANGYQGKHPKKILKNTTQRWASSDAKKDLPYRKLSKH